MHCWWRILARARHLPASCLSQGAVDDELLLAAEALAGAAMRPEAVS